MPVWIRTQAQTMAVEVSVVAVESTKEAHSIIGEPWNDPQTTVELARYASQGECHRAFGKLIGWISRGGHGVYHLNSSREE